MASNFQKYHAKLSKRGVCYFAQIPTKMTVAELRSHFSKYGISRIYLVPKKHQGSNHSNKFQKYEEGWMEFDDKRVAKAVAYKHNGSQVMRKKHSRGSDDDFWCIKYLSKFKWENLVGQIQDDYKIKKAHLEFQAKVDRNKIKYYREKIQKNKQIKAIKYKKMLKKRR